MAENVQAALSWNASLIMQLPGINLTPGVQTGSGGSIQVSLFASQVWMEVRKTAATNDFFQNTFLNHNYLHWFMDPTSAGPSILVRVEDIVVMDWGASATARAFYGFGEWTVNTNPASLRGIGFYADSNGNWFALVSDAAGDRLRVDTGISAATAHLLRFEMDASAKTVTFFIDNVQVATVTLAAALGQISSATGNGTGLNFIQGVQGTAEQASLYMSTGMQTQLVFITNEADAPAGAGWTPCDTC